jgi:hypothetical protein
LYVKQAAVAGERLELLFRSHVIASRQWLMPVILATQEAQIRRIAVRSQFRQIKKKAGDMAQGEGPEFKPQY